MGLVCPEMLGRGTWWDLDRVLCGPSAAVVAMLMLMANDTGHFAAAQVCPPQLPHSDSFGAALPA